MSVAKEKAARLGTMCDTIQASELIILGIANSDATIKVTKVLKGDPKLQGQVLKYPEIRSSCGAYPAPSASPQAVLFSRNWKTSTNPFLEVFNTPDRIGALNCLLSTICNGQTYSEKQKLDTVFQLWKNPESFCNEKFATDPRGIFREEFLGAIREMRDPQNFAIAEKAYNEVSPEDQLKLLEWIGDTGDKRAVPILLSALKSNDRYLNSSAAVKLVYYYPDADGVAEAMMGILNDGPDELRSVAYRYLTKSKYASHIAPYESKLPAKTTYQKALELKTQGKTKDALPLYLAVIQSKQADKYTRRSAALEIINSASIAQKDLIRQSLLPILHQDAKAGNYLEAADAAIILRGLHHAQCLPSLIALLDRHEFLFEPSQRTATMAIKELGTSARKNASLHLLDQIRNDRVSDSESKIVALVALANLADSEGLNAIEPIIKNKPNWQIASEQVAALLAEHSHLTTAEEGPALIKLLHKPNSRHVRAWAIYRLGDMKYEAAVPALIQQLTSELGNMPYIVDNALKNIGGTAAEDALTKIALDSSSNVQSNALDILSELQHERALPILRKVIRQKNAVGKTQALSNIGRFGKAEDLEYLIAQSDYWTGDRTQHYWYMQAIAGIRDRKH